MVNNDICTRANKEQEVLKKVLKDNVHNTSKETEQLEESYLILANTEDNDSINNE